MRIRDHSLLTSLPIKAKHFDAALASADPRNRQTCPIAQALAEAIPDAITLPEVAFFCLAGRPGAFFSRSPLLCWVAQASWEGMEAR